MPITVSTLTSSFSCRAAPCEGGKPTREIAEQGGRGRAVAAGYTPRPNPSGRGCAPRRARPRAGRSRRWRACTASSCACSTWNLVSCRSSRCATSLA
eukprot:scaffold5350_cov75-Phaeocystis_antarctica.AAC.1